MKVTQIVFIILGCLSYVSGQNIAVRPNYLRDGDGKTRNVTLEAQVQPGTIVHISVHHKSAPRTQTVNFIARFPVQDNANGDRNPEIGRIRAVLPRAFTDLGIYFINVEELGSIRLVNEPDNRSSFRQFADWLMSAGGSGHRGPERESAVDRLGRLSERSIWIAPLPVQGQALRENLLTIRIKDAMMPAWSKSGSYIACSAWRERKSMLALYTFKRNGELSERWRWRGSVTGNDLSPVWSPDGQMIAFIRVSANHKTDIWLLTLDQHYRPLRESKLTNLGSVKEIFYWDHQMGIIFGHNEMSEGSSAPPELWAVPVSSKSKLEVSGGRALSEAYVVSRGQAHKRGTLVVSVENDAPPISVIYEMKPNGERWRLLTGDVCSYQWPVVSPNSAWLAVDSDCPEN